MCSGLVQLLEMSYAMLHRMGIAYHICSWYEQTPYWKRAFGLVMWVTFKQLSKWLHLFSLGFATILFAVQDSTLLAGALFVVAAGLSAGTSIELEE